MAAMALRRQKRDPSPWCSRMRTTGQDRKPWTISRSLRTIESRARAQRSDIERLPEPQTANGGSESAGEDFFRASGRAPVTRCSLRHERCGGHNDVGAQRQIPVLRFLVDALLGAWFPVPHCRQPFRGRSQEFANSQFRFV